MKLSALPGIPAPFAKKAEETFKIQPSSVEGGGSWWPSLGSLLGLGAGAGAGAYAGSEVLKELSGRLGPGVTGLPDVGAIMKTLKDTGPVGTPRVPGFMQQPGLRGALEKQLSGINVASMSGKRLPQYLRSIPHSGLSSKEGGRAVDWLVDQLRSGKYGGHKPGSADIKQLLKDLAARSTPGKGAVPGIPTAVSNAIKTQLQSFSPAAPTGAAKWLGGGAAMPDYDDLITHLQKATPLKGKKHIGLLETAARESLEQLKKTRPKGRMAAYRNIPGTAATFGRTGRFSKYIPSKLGRKSLFAIIPLLLGGLGYMLGRD